MATELELKVRIADPTPYAAILSQLGAKRLHRHFEINTFFDTPGQTLRLADSGLRIRLARDIDTGVSTVVLTHKGPRQPGKYKLRPEHEMIADSYDRASAFLRALGYGVALSFEKHRESWQLNDCEIELDELPQLGRFLEIEGPSESSIAAVQQLLGLQDAPHVQEGYASLVAQHLRGTGSAELRFPQSAADHPL